MASKGVSSLSISDAARWYVRVARDGMDVINSVSSLGETNFLERTNLTFIPRRARRRSWSMSDDVFPKVMTLLMVVQNGRVLLGEKKRGFGAGFWNGFGGKVEDGEGVDEAALRELQEECGIDAVDMSKRGVLQFVYDDQSRPMEVHVYHCSQFTGDIVETDEMRPRWWAIEKIPLEKMWPDDEHWYPLFLANKYFTGTVQFTNTTTIVEHDIREVLQATLTEISNQKAKARRERSGAA